jgi:hypothetical protein
MREEEVASFILSALEILGPEGWLLRLGVNDTVFQAVDL